MARRNCGARGGKEARVEGERGKGIKEVREVKSEEERSGDYVWGPGRGMEMVSLMIDSTMPTRNGGGWGTWVGREKADPSLRSE